MSTCQVTAVPLGMWGCRSPGGAVRAAPGTQLPVGGLWARCPTPGTFPAGPACCGLTARGQGQRCGVLLRAVPRARGANTGAPRPLLSLPLSPFCLCPSLFSSRGCQQCPQGPGLAAASSRAAPHPPRHPGVRPGATGQPGGGEGRGELSLPPPGRYRLCAHSSAVRSGSSNTSLCAFLLPGQPWGPTPALSV